MGVWEKVIETDASAYGQEQSTVNEEALQKNAVGMAEALGVEPPTMIEDCTAEVEADSNIFIMRSSDLENIEGEKVFDTEEARSFYEELPDAAHLVAELRTHSGETGGATDDGDLAQAGGAPEEPSGELEDWEVCAQQEKLLEEGAETDSDRLERLLLRLPKLTGKEECDDLSILLCRLCSKFS